MNEKLANSFLVDCEELQKLLISSIKTAKGSIRLRLKSILYSLYSIL